MDDRDTIADDINLKDDNETPSIDRKDSAADLLSPGFFRRSNWFDDMFEILFHVKARNTTVRGEIYYGFVHFVSCLYVLAVIPQQLVNAGYSDRSSVITTSLCCGLGSLVGGLFTNLPFVIAPPTVVSIYLVAFLREKNLGPEYGNAAVVLSGFSLIFLGFKPLSHFIGFLIPLPIQVGTTVGIGLLTALAGATEIGLIKNGGEYQILKKGEVSTEQLIAISGLVIISVAIHYKIKAAFCIALIFCTLVWWIYDNDWPTAIGAKPSFHLTGTKGFSSKDSRFLTFDLTFLYILYLSGITTSLSNLADLTRENGEIPRGRWIYIITGILTMLSGVLYGPPILISPESAAGIKAGAKTGLSTVVCGLLFLVSMFMSPIFQHVPHAGTSPVLLMIGTLLFQNVNRIDWSDVKDAAPAFCVLFFIPFMYSVVEGVLMGYYVYLLIGLLTGDLLHNTVDFLKYYSSYLTPKIDSLQQNGHFQRSTTRTADEEIRSAIVLVSFRGGKSRGRTASCVGQRSLNLRSDSSCLESPSRNSCDDNVGTFTYQHDNIELNAEISPSALAAEDIEDLKSMRSLKFTVFD